MLLTTLLESGPCYKECIVDFEPLELGVYVPMSYFLHGCPDSWHASPQLKFSSATNKHHLHEARQ